MIDFSLRHLNFSLNKLYKGQYVLYLFKGIVHLPKNYLPWGTPTETQEMFHFPCNRIKARDMMFNATFNNISVVSWQSVLLVKETGVPRENHRSAACQRHTLSYNVVASRHPHELDSNSQL